MVVEARSLTPVLTMRVSVRCTGARKDGRLCDFLLARIEWTAFDGKLELVCPKCHTKTVFR